MVGSWKTTQLRNVTSEIGDGLHGTPKYTNNGAYAFINGNNLSNGRVILKPDTKYVTKEEYLKYRKPLNNRTLLLSINGTLGNVAEFNGEDVILGKSACYINVARDIDYKFIKYVISSPTFQEYLVRFSTGTTIKNASLQQIREYTFNIPSLHEQKLIAATLSSLDDKIELNNRIIANLDAQAQAIFKSWFVDFEPFQDGEFEETELGLIPKGWRIERLGDALDIQNGIFKPNSDSIIVEHYSIPAYDDLRFPVFEEASCIKSNKFYLDTDCFMISKLNPETKRIWRPLCLTSRAVCSTEFIVYKAKHPEQKFFYYSLVDGVDFFNFLISHVTGSTGSRQRATPKDTLEFRYALPSNELIDEFVSIVTPIYKEIDTLSIENVKLKSTRDTLLPKLMSGEIEVPVEV